jgi:Peroxiredoxin
MIIDREEVTPAEFEAGTGWALKPEGACRGEVCVPLRDAPGEHVDVRAVAEALGMPIVEDAEHGVSALGPATLNGRALASAEAPDLELEDLEGNAFRLSQLRGQKILVYAWAPY